MEPLLFACLAAAGALCLSSRRSLGTWAVRCAALGLIVAIVDMALGNWRWQIMPAYVLAVVMLIAAYWRSRSSEPPGHRTWGRVLGVAAGALLLCVLLVAALAPPLIFPMFEAPAPSGSYGVGIVDIHLVDMARAETMTEDPGDRRELVVRAWYPASIPQGARPEPFLREIEPLHHVFARGRPYLRPFMLSHLTRIPGHSYLNAPPAEGESRFPVLIFSHGNSFYASQNTLLMEQLASHGYVVFGIDHPYQASSVRFPDGRVAKYKRLWNVEGEMDPEEMKRDEEIFYHALFADSYERYLQLMTQLVERAPGANKGVKIWVNDTSMLLNELARQGSGVDAGIDRLMGRLDLDRVGLFGMSYGGAAAAEFCSQDARCKAGLNMDGLLYGAAGTSLKIEQPFMFLNSDRRREAAARVGGVSMDKPAPFDPNDFAFTQARNRVYSLTIEGATHMGFSDFALADELGRLSGMYGTIEPRVMRDLLNESILAFFDHTLKGARGPLLDGSLAKRAAVLKFVQRDGRLPPAR